MKTQKPHKSILWTSVLGFACGASDECFCVAFRL